MKFVCLGALDLFELLGFFGALHKCFASQKILGIVKFHYSSTHGDQTGAGVSDGEYILAQVLTGNFLLLHLYLGCTTYQRVIPFGYFLLLLVHGHQGPLLYFLEYS